MYISLSVLFPNVQSLLRVLHLFCVCTVVHRLPADSPVLLTLAHFHCPL